MRKLMAWLPWALLVMVLGSFFVWNKEHKEEQTLAADGKKMSQEKHHALVEHSPSGGVSSYSEAVKATAPAVVSIFTLQKIDNSKNPLMSDPILRELFGGQNPYSQQQNESNLGSGVIVREDGYILTNNHVIANAEQIVVALHDGTRADAKVIGVDEDTDLAVIKIEATDLPVLPFKLSGNRVGDVVLAIGNPFGVGQTVTQGIISATERMDLGINTYENFIQTDAAINPGNSGGALIDVSGNLVGVNTAIYSRSGGSMGIGFAIPAATSKQVLDSILQHGRVVRGWLGVSLDRSDRANSQTPLYQKGLATVTAVLEGGPAGKAGIMPGDQILQVNDEKIKSATHLVNYIALQAPNSTVKLKIKRNGQELESEVVVGDRQEQEKYKRATREYLYLPNSR